ncbi:MAG: hypothetical protein LC732_01090 [Acidobacteria bacterium]|nr:hypothetical protein [Acidobacteriota bacterium]
MLLFEKLALVAGTVVPALLVVAATRRWLEPVRWRSAAFLFFLACCFVAPALLTSGLPVPVDEVARGYPYKGVFGDVTPKNALTNDTVKLFLPWMKVAREELFAGRAALWNRYSYSGYPLLANGESAPFSPFFLATLIVPLPAQIVAMAVLKIFVALLFGYLLLRLEKVGPVAATVGSAAFAFSMYQTVYLYYSAAAVSALMPASALAFLQIVRTGRRRWVVFAALVVASLLAAGHPESVLHVAIGTIVVLLIDLVSRGVDRRLWLRRFGLAIAAAALGLALSAPAWVPVLEQVLGSARLAEIRAVEREMTAPFPAGMLWALVNPDAYGNPARGSWNWIFNYSIVASSFFGLIPLGLTLGSLFSRCSRRDRGWAIGAVVVFLVSMNWTFIGNLFNSIPPLSIVSNDKMRFVAIFLGALATGRALQRIREGKGAVEAVGAAAVAAVAGYLFVVKVGGPFGAYAIVGAAGAALFAVAVFARNGSPIPAAVAAAVLAAELAVFAFPFNPAVERKYYAPQLPIIDAIRQHAPDEPFRIVGFDWVFLPNASAQYGLEDIRGSDPMAWATYVDFFRAIQVPDETLDVRRVIAVDEPALDFLNVHFLLTEPDQQVGDSWKLVYAGADGKLYRNAEAMPRFFLPSSLVGRTDRPLPEQIRALRDGKEVIVDGKGSPVAAGASLWFRRMSPVSYRLTVDSPEPVFVASSQPALSGWKIESRGGETIAVRRVNGAFIGFDVPAGKTQLRVRYAPFSFTISVVIALAAFGALVAASWRKRGGKSFARD